MRSWLDARSADPIGAAVVPRNFAPNREDDLVPEPITDLAAMLLDLRPREHEGRYVFVTVGGALPAGLQPVMTFAEDEGLTAIVTVEQADAAGLPYELVTAWVTLQVHSALAGVGLTAAVSGALAAA